MYSFSLSVAALALVASGAFAHDGSQRGAEQAASQNAEQRGGPTAADRAGNRGDRPAKAEDARSSAAELRSSRENAPNAQRVVSEVLSNQDRRETGNPAPQAAERATSRARNPDNQTSQNRMRDLANPQSAERVLERMVTGPLDRSARMIPRCPPGLAKKGGCQPPGQSRAPASQRDSLLGAAYSPLLFGLTGFDPGRYLYRDGYLMQLANGDGIAGYIPLLGGALASGNIWPGDYGSQTVPAYLVDFYSLGEPGSYRYADNTLFRLDPQSGVIQSVAALLTDENVTIGQPMPAGYDVYNVPFTHRDRFADTAEAIYRYVDGYVYRLDPQTRLVAAAIDLLT